MKVRAKEGALLVDAHGKVMGEPRVHSHEPVPPKNLGYDGELG